MPAQNLVLGILKVFFLFECNVTNLDGLGPLFGWYPLEAKVAYPCVACTSGAFEQHTQSLTALHVDRVVILKVLAEVDCPSSCTSYNQSPSCS